MPTRFDQCLRFVLEKEGGKVDDPKDRGGRTNQGITQQTYDAYRMRRGYALKDVWDIGANEVKEIYLSGFWTPLCCGQLPKGLDIAVFDWGVNTGVKRAARHLQTALGMHGADVDGVIGAKTLTYVHDAVTSDEVDQVIRRFNDLRLNFYKGLVANDKTQERFIKGWTNRVASVIKQIESDIA